MMQGSEMKEIMTRKYAFHIITLVYFIAMTMMPLHQAVSAEISKSMQSLISSAGKDEPIKVWIYFKDKDESRDNFQKAAASFTSRALQRRTATPPDWYDLPVNQNYVDDVRAVGAGNIRVSRWLNAVSARLTADQIARLAEKEFVKKIEPVVKIVRRPDPQPPADKIMPVIDSAAYGMSFAQNHMLRVDSLHKAGLRGSGVLLAFFDTGYLPTHPAFDSIHVLDTWNFIDSNAYVADPADDQTEHGTATLSACGGFDSGQLVGPAYAADYILAKTEYQHQEIEIEEDFWVAAAEWADSLGADNRRIPQRHGSAR